MASNDCVSAYVSSTLSIIAGSSLILPIYLYISAYYKNKLKASRKLFYFGVTLSIAVILDYVILSIGSYTICSNFTLSLQLFQAWLPIYFFQGGILLTILFLRLKAIP